MTILCSAEKGVLSKAECLECARDYPPCGYDYSLVRYILRDNPREGIHVTDLTGCLRKAAWEKLVPMPEYLHDKLVVTLGTAIHKALEGDDEYLDSELHLEGLGITGMADVVYKSGRVIDHKTTRWMMPSRLPYSNHGMQVNIYAQLLREMGYEVESLGIQYVDVSGPTKCRSCKIPVRTVDGVVQCPGCGNTPRNAHLGAMVIDIPMLPPGDIVEYIVERRDIIAKALDTEELPPGEPSFLCTYCNYQDECPDAR